MKVEANEQEIELIRICVNFGSAWSRKFARTKFGVKAEKVGATFGSCQETNKKREVNKLCCFTQFVFDDERRKRNK